MDFLRDFASRHCIIILLIGIAGIIGLIYSVYKFNKIQEAMATLNAERDRIQAEKQKALQEIENTRKIQEAALIQRRLEQENALARERKASLDQLHEFAQKQADDFAVKQKEYEEKIASERKEQEIIQADIRRKLKLIDTAKSNLTMIPYMAGIIADLETHGLELLAQRLDWGHNQERAKKVLSIREIRKEAAEAIAKSKEAQYQLEYAIRMFPGLEDFLETDYRELHEMDLADIDEENHDRTRNYLTKEEYSQLSTADRNQLALDRYRNSHRKTNWQIGRDYELYVGYLFSKNGYKVEFFGSENGLEDLGRDLIAEKDGKVLIIQCKYWGSNKQIHEKHINQLYGTMMCYCFENNLSEDQVSGVLITNIALSNTAKQFAAYLGIRFREGLPMGEYPCIKCNINRDQYGSQTKIYHLPFDQQYDACKVDAPGEFFAMTTAEAEAAGFRRAFRWHDAG
jgi:hypothetical protein